MPPVRTARLDGRQVTLQQPLVGAADEAAEAVSCPPDGWRRRNTGAKARRRSAGPTRSTPGSRNDSRGGKPVGSPATRSAPECGCDSREENRAGTTDPGHREEIENRLRGSARRVPRSNRVVRRADWCRRASVRRSPDWLVGNPSYPAHRPQTCPGARALLVQVFPTLPADVFRRQIETISPLHFCECENCFCLHSNAERSATDRRRLP